MYSTLALLRPATRVATAASSVRSLAHASGAQPAPVMLRDQIFFAKATADGPGREGHIFANGDSEPLNLNMAIPKMMGGKGHGQNPEKLFASGYASCFLGALQMAAASFGKPELGEKAKVHAKVVLGHPDPAALPGPQDTKLGEGLGLGVELIVEGIKDDRIIKAAHEFCPYSRLMQHGGDVSIKTL
ncbi:OsmC-like protein [Punctularia strigosozonata HHB-11173 SS5]|uniref:OsmC-like protein n=1 Tax=Punctularia strigosozonata (strain HHB-11173) TaxID=741275 RepID=UPI0004417D00|nr:OsmC-like protein [Punctularia strigosozonata HHB-11173 SS5]EIN11388.1 OsmC-like protein [Punctularia strigosozonata HHB-11173 SS5]